jgi:hypothetical protein
MSSEAGAHKGQVSLRGNTAFSFSEAFFLIQVNDGVYQIRKSALSSEQIEHLTKAGAGGEVDISIPTKAVDLAWSFKQPVIRKTASVENTDKVKMGKSEVGLIGTVLYSFDEPLVLVQSNDVIYQIQRKMISTATPAAFDNPGSKVQLTTPIEAVQFVWSGDVKNVEFKRAPASLH